MNSLDSDLNLIERHIRTLDIEDSGMLGISADDDLNRINSLRSLYITYNSLLKKNNLKWAQRARLMWVSNSDLNSSIFHNCAHINKHKNSIFHILAQNGNLKIDRADIEDTYITHYIRLWSNLGLYSYTDLI